MCGFSNYFCGRGIDKLTFCGKIYVLMKIKGDNLYDEQKG